VPYIAIGVATTITVLLLGYVLFDIAIKGSYLLLSLTTILFLFAALGMGVLISTITRTQQMAFQVAVLTSMLPAIILSGFIFPIQNMPIPIQTITLVIIPRYFVAALRQIILKDATFMDVLPHLTGLMILGILFNLLATIRIRKSI
jgi:ABC-2 type transport system permease protein